MDKNHPTAPLPDEELAAIESDLAKYPNPSRNGPHDPLEYARTLLAALRAERAARARLEAFAEKVAVSEGDSPGTRAAARFALTGSLDGVVDEMRRAALAPATGEGAEE
jgi:hypothetical protein